MGVLVNDAQTEQSFGKKKKIKFIPHTTENNKLQMNEGSKCKN